MFWARRRFTAAVTPDQYVHFVDLLSPYQTESNSDIEGCTITRIRGHFWPFNLVGTTGEPEIHTLSVGIKVDDEGQFSLRSQTELAQLYLPSGPGIGTGPGASTPAHQDWMYVRNENFVVETEPNMAQLRQAYTTELDLKSQRRMDELTQSLFFIVGTANPPATSFNFYADMHVLVKRP